MTIVYRNTSVEITSDPVVTPRIGMSDSTVEITSDPVVTPRIGMSDSDVETISDVVIGYINIGESNATFEITTESDGGLDNLTSKTVNINDNTTETIIIGNKNSSYSLFIDFTIVALTSGETLTGKIYITHNNTDTNMDVEYIDNGITGISFDSRINGNDIELDVIATSVGENLKIIYYVRQTL